MMSLCSKQKEDHHGQQDKYYNFKQPPGTRKEPIESERKTWTIKHAISSWLRSTGKK